MLSFNINIKSHVLGLLCGPYGSIDQNDLDWKVSVESYDLSRHPQNIEHMMTILGRKIQYNKKYKKLYILQA